MTTVPRKQRARVAAPEGTPPTEAEHLVAVLQQLVEPLAAALPSTSEVVVHDLSRLPDSIVAVHGDVTGRSVGDPATDVLLEHLARGQRGDMVGYSTELPSGARLQSSTVLVHDRTGEPVAALCINSDLTAWQALAELSASMLPADSVPTHATTPVPGPVAPQQERFVRHVDELAGTLVREAIDSVGVPVELMKKQHKVEVVGQLQRRGFFLLRDAAETIADALSVSRFTIYNYLNELADDSAAESASAD